MGSRYALGSAFENGACQLPGEVYVGHLPLAGGTLARSK